MKILTNARYNELISYEKKYKQATNEAQRKEFVVQRKQRIINNIDKRLNKLPDKPKKDDLQQIIEDINKEINK